jgi:hypothetical protein
MYIKKMVRKDPVKEIITPNYIKRTITVRPDKDNQLFTFKQVKEFCEKKEKQLPANAKMVVRGLNILRDTTLKSYDDDFMNEDEYDEYSIGKNKDSSKFNKFFNFTITILEPNTQNMFLKK